MGETLIVFGGVYFNQYASDFNEYSWNTFDNLENIGMSLMKYLEV